MDSSKLASKLNAECASAKPSCERFDNSFLSGFLAKWCGEFWNCDAFDTLKKVRFVQMYFCLIIMNPGFHSWEPKHVIFSEPSCNFADPFPPVRFNDKLVSCYASSVWWLHGRVSLKLNSFCHFLLIRTSCKQLRKVISYRTVRGMPLSKNSFLFLFFFITRYFAVLWIISSVDAPRLRRCSTWARASQRVHPSQYQRRSMYVSQLFCCCNSCSVFYWILPSPGWPLCVTTALL